jgi:hypothetical protein
MVLNWNPALWGFALALALHSSLQAGEAGTVRVVDGDTIEVDGIVYSSLNKSSFHSDRKTKYS